MLTQKRTNTPQLPVCSLKSTGTRLSDRAVPYYLLPNTNIIKIGNLTCISAIAIKLSGKIPCFYYVEKCMLCTLRKVNR